MKLELFYNVLQVKCCAHGVQIENMSITFISNEWETSMTSQGDVTTASPITSISESSTHSSFELHTVNIGTLNSKM